MPSALCLAEESVMPHADSFLMEKALDYPVCWHWIHPVREGRDPAPCSTGASSLVKLRTGVNSKSRCLKCGSVPYAAGESCVATIPSSSPADRHQHCLLNSSSSNAIFVFLASFRTLPSLCDKSPIGRVSATRYLNVDQDVLSEAAQSSAEQCVLKMCPRALARVHSWAVPDLPCGLLLGRAPGGWRGGHPGLSSALALPF